jgi:hypothetical protein
MSSSSSSSSSATQALNTRTVTTANEPPDSANRQSEFSHLLVTGNKWMADDEDTCGQLFKEALQRKYLKKGLE